MKFRPQRGGLAEAMAEVQEIDPTIQGVSDALKSAYGSFAPIGEITVEPYGYDDRIGWDTHLVCVNGNACGYTDGPVTPSDASENHG